MYNVFMKISVCFFFRFTLNLKKIKIVKIKQEGDKYLKYEDLTTESEKIKEIALKERRKKYKM